MRVEYARKANLKKGDVKLVNRVGEGDRAVAGVGTAERHLSDFSQADGSGAPG